MSFVTAYEAASPEIAAEYFAQKLRTETDCSDVHQAIRTGDVDFVLLHVVGSREAFAGQHIAGAIHLPHREISEAALARWDKDALFVVYCAGPHCNGADQAALTLSTLRRKVKLMIGGLTGWADEGFEFARSRQTT